MIRPTQAILFIGLLALIPSCATVDVKPIKVEPIHVVVDINLRVDRQLDQFFDFEDQFSEPVAAPPATQPSAAAGQAARPSTRPTFSHLQSVQVMGE